MGHVYRAGIKTNGSTIVTTGTDLPILNSMQSYTDFSYFLLEKYGHCLCLNFKINKKDLGI